MQMLDDRAADDERTRLRARMDTEVETIQVKEGG